MKSMKTLILIFAALTQATAWADAVIFSGNDVKTLKPNIDLNGQGKILSGVTDPTSSAVSAPVGSVYLNTSNGNLYRKVDAGSSTNWQKVGSAAVAGNLLPNPDWETGTTGWTASAGTYTRTTTAANVAFGAGSGSWDASAASQTLTSTAVAIPTGLYGSNGLVRCSIKTTATDYVLQAYDGTNVLASATVRSGTQYSAQSVNFIFPSSGNIQVRVVSASDASVIYLDDCYLGSASNLTNVSQAQVYGSWRSAGTGNCMWTVTQSTYASDFPADTDCSTPVVSGGVSAAGTKVPHFVLSNAPPGTYSISVDFPFYSTTTGGNTWACRLVDGDGTQIGSERGTRYYSVTSSTVDARFLVHVEGQVTYTTSASRTIKIQCRSDSNASNIEASFAGRDLNASVLYFPSSSQLALQPDQVANSWSGYHDSTCSWARTNTTYGDPTADATCGLTERKNNNFGTVTSYLSGTDKLPGIVFTPKKANSTYFVCASIKSLGNTLSASLGYRLWDGTTTIYETNRTEDVATNVDEMNMCGLYTAASVSSVTLSVQSKASAGSTTISNTGDSASTIEWSVFDLSSLGQLQIANQVQTSNAGGESIQRARIANAGSASITSQSGSWITSVNRNTTGDISVNIASGTFSSTPSCVCMVENAEGRICMHDDGTSPTSSLVRFQTTVAGGSATDVNISIVCMGPR